MADVQRQLELFDIARSVMRNTGNMEQWTNGYPSQEVIEDDIVAGNSYVCMDDEGRVRMIRMITLKMVNG